MYSKESELKSGHRAPRVRVVAPSSAADTSVVSRSNSGVDARRARDSSIVDAAAASSSSDALHASSAQKMQIKAKIYERLVAGHVGEEGDAQTFSVDFERKGWERQDDQQQKKRKRGEEEEEEEEYQPDASDVIVPSSSILYPPPSTYHSSSSSVPRADWERSALAELSAPSVDVPSVSSAGRKLLSADDKTALDDVIQRSQQERREKAQRKQQQRDELDQRRQKIEEKNQRKNAFYAQYHVASAAVHI